MIHQQDGFINVNQTDLEKIILDRVIFSWESYLLNLLIIKKIDQTYFKTALYRNIFTYLLWEYKKNWSIPSDTAVESIFQGYTVSPIKDSILTALDELIYRWTREKAKEITVKINSLLSRGNSPIQLVRDLQEIYTMPRWIKEESYFVKRSDLVAEQMKHKIDDWEDFTGLKVWMKYIDNDLWGIKPTDFIGVLADEKTWKSWIMLWFAYQMMKEGKNVLFVSPEMDSVEVEERLHLIHTNFHSQEFFQWKLTPEQFILWRQKNDEIKKNFNSKKWWEIIIIDDIELSDFNITTIKARLNKVDLQLKVALTKGFPSRKEEYENMKHHVDCIIIDGFHLLNWADIRKWMSEWKESQLVSQGLRFFARNEKIPILVSLHTNRNSQQAEEKIIPDNRDTSLTASLWRDVTCLLSLFSTPSLREKKKLWMACTLSRRSEKWKIWNLEFNIEEGRIKPIQKIQNEKEFHDEQNRETLSGEMN